MMWLFLQLIVLGLAASDAAKPVNEFEEICLVIVESNNVEPNINGIYIYDPEGEVINNVPTMYMRRGTEVGNDDKSVVYNNKDIVRERKLFYVHGDGILFSNSKLRLFDTSSHPCKLNPRQQFWEIVDVSKGSVHAGWVQRTDGTVGTTCTPTLLAGNGMPHITAPHEFQTVNACVSWLKELSKESGVPSYATGAELDPVTGSCSIYYERHSDMKTLKERNIFCFLELPKPFPEVPGYFSSCQIYLQDPVFVGLWLLDFSTSNLHQPLLRKRRITMDSPPSPVLTLHDDFEDGMLAVFIDDHMLFSNEDGDSILKVPMKKHICFGDYVSTTIEFEGSNSEPGVLSRNDAGLGCGPFYGLWNLPVDSKFLGVSTNYMEQTSTLNSCYDFVSDLHPFGQWRAVISTLQYIPDWGFGPCVAYGGGLDLNILVYSAMASTYSCISFENSNLTNPETCQYVVEAGIYSDYYKLDVTWENNYSNYPTLKKLITSDDGLHVVKIPLEFSENVNLTWEGDGYHLVGLEEKWSVHFEDGEICFLGADDSSVRKVSLEGVKKGIIYRYDEAVYCSPAQENRSAGDFLGYLVFEDATSLLHCRDLALLDSYGVGFKAFVRNGSDCWAYGEGLYVNNFVKSDTCSTKGSTCDDFYSCIVEEFKDAVPGIDGLDRDCRLSIVGNPNFDGTYVMDAVYTHNVNLYPSMIRKSISLSGGVVNELTDHVCAFVEVIDGKTEMLFYDVESYATTRNLSSDTNFCDPSVSFGFLKAFDGGKIYKIDPNSNFCHIIDSVYDIDDYDDFTTVKRSAGKSFETCEASASVISSNTQWKALVKRGKICKAYDLRLPITRFVEKPNQKGTTCIFTKQFN